VNRKAYEYDVNSAYPSALRSVPNLAEGRWNHIDGDAPQLPFAIYHVEFTGNRSDIPAPLFRRDPNGTICYPMAVTGWYWSPEMQALRNYCERGYGKYRILECWEFRPTSEVSPFAFIEPLYNKRRALKKAGDGAHVGIKLALNSLYGKLAQQVGWEQTEKGLRIPPFHQLEWAGYTTSHCRAAVLNAALHDIESVIAFETDALFTSRPLPVKLGTNLGDFEYTEFANLTYVQSGMYFGQLADGTEVVSKTRGVDRGQLTRELVLEKLTVPKAAERYAVTELTRFIGAGIALAQNFDKWCRWVHMEKHMVLEPTGKRIHIQCAACDGSGITLGEWHETMCPFLTAEHSAEFPIEWINPNPEMTELSIMRGEEVDYE
jgi:hypothetical protein